MLRTILATAAVLGLGLQTSAVVLTAQPVLDRTPLLSGGWVGTPGSLAISASFRFSAAERPGQDVFVVPTMQAALGLPSNALAGARYSAQSPLFSGDADWEVFGRYKLLDQYDGAPVDAGLHLGFNGGAGSVDAELSVARWFGSLRLIGAARAFSDAFGSGDARGALGAGAVWYPQPRSMPVALAADAALPLDRRSGEKAAWSGALLVGIPYAINTVSLFATNTAAGSLQGMSVGFGDTRWGLELTLPIPAGRLLGWYLPRETAAKAVTEVPAPPPTAVDATIFRYAYLDSRIVVPAGTTIRWTNRDAVVHTVSADDGTWDSGAIPPGHTWSAIFDEPGTYPFHCGPHPFMKGAVIVR